MRQYEPKVKYVNGKVCKYCHSPLEIVEVYEQGKKLQLYRCSNDGDCFDPLIVDNDLLWNDGRPERRRR